MPPTRVVVSLLLLTVCGCQGMINSRVDNYLDVLEDRAIRDAMDSAQAVGAPLDLYAILWDKGVDTDDRLNLAAHLIADLFKNGVHVESVVHVGISVAVMLGHSYRGNEDP